MTTTLARDRVTRDQLVEDHLPLVRHIADKLPVATGAILDRDDLHSAGVIGLLRAAEIWDPQGGASFSTFAYTVVRGAILDEVRRHDPVPRPRRDRLRRMQRAGDDLRAELGRAPTLDELAESLGVAVDELDADLLALHTARTLSIDTGSDRDDGDAEYRADDRLQPSSTEPDPAARAADTELCEQLADAIAKLPERERHILVLHYHEELYLREIGRLLGVSESRICQLLARATGRLRLALDGPMRDD